MKKMKQCFCLLFTLILILLPAEAAYGGEYYVDGQLPGSVTQAPYFLVESNDTSTDCFPLKKTDVNANINGVIAETFVTQTYTNEGEKPLNASYLFPASNSVAIHGLKMTIGDHVVTAAIKEKEEAKEEFEEAKEEGKSATLLEQQRPNVFSMNIANIMPGDTVMVELHYTELIVPTEGTYQFVFPTVAGPRYVSPVNEGTGAEETWTAVPYLSEGKTPDGEYNITVNLSTGVPVTKLHCPTHKTEIVKEGDPKAKVTLANPKDYAGNRDYILEYRLTGDELGSGLMLNTGEKENFFMLTLQPPERFQEQEILPREYIFVLDVSGSMSGFPLETAKKMICDLVTGLNETDTFNVILFSGYSEQLSRKSLPATKENMDRAVKLIEEQNSGGGTELVPALTSALDIPREENTARSIVVITDGYLNNESSVFEMIKDNLETTSFFSFGIGSAVNRYLIEGIAKAGQGEAFIITDPNKTTDAAKRFRTYIQSPLLTDIHVEFQGFDVYDTEPARLPTLFAERPVILYGKWRGEPTGTIKVTGKSGNQDFVSEISVDGTLPEENNNAIRYLWARKRVEELTDYGCNSQDEPAVKKEVTRLGLEYSMMTPYTSFIAVIDVIRNPEAESTDVNQPLPLPLEVSDLAIGYTIGSEPGDLMLIAALISILTITLLRCRNRPWRRKIREV